MALDTYTNLKAEIALWLNRQDLTAQIPTFITLLEAQAERSLHVRQMETRSYATLDEQFLELPEDFHALKTVQLNSDPVTPLDFVPMRELDEIRRQNAGVAGRPVASSPVGDCRRAWRESAGGDLPVADHHAARGWHCAVRLH